MTAPLPNSRGGASGRSRLRRHAAACGALLLLTLAFHAQVVLHLGTRLDQAGDPLLNAWILSWDLHALATAPGGLWNANIFHPHPYTLAYSENLLVPALLVAPLRAAADNPVLVYNVAFLLGVFLSAVCAYALGFYLAGASLPAMLLAAAFALGPFRLAHAAHIQCQHGGWLALAVLFALICFDRADGPTRRRAGWLAGIAVCLCAQFLSNTYYFMFCAPCLALLQACRWAGLPAERKRIAAIEIAACWCLAALLTAPFVRPYAAARHEAGLTRSPAELAEFSARIGDYLLGYNENNLWFGAGQAARGVERRLAPGAVILVCALLPALRVTGRAARSAARVARDLRARACAARRSAPASAAWAGRWFAALRFLTTTRGALLVVAAFAVWMSLGPGRGPYGLFFRFVPGYDGLRVPARFAGVAALGLGALAAMHLAAATARMPGRAGRVAAAAALAAVLAEYASRPRPMGFGMVERPVYGWLRQAPPGAVVELPLPLSRRDIGRDSVFVFYSTRHWKPLLNGYSGYAPPSYHVACRYLESFPSEESVRVLQRLGVRYVVVNRCTESRARRVAQWFDPAASFGRDRVFTVPSAREPPGVRAASPLFIPLLPTAWGIEGASPPAPAADGLRDGNPATAWAPGPGQRQGARLDFAFREPRASGCLRLHFGRRADAFPRRLELLGQGPTGDWCPVAFEQDPVDYISSALERPLDPTMDIVFHAEEPLVRLRLLVTDGESAWGLSVSDVEILESSDSRTR